MEVPRLDPDVKAFREAENDAERASVLLAAPFGTLLRWRAVLARYANAVGFEAGLAYLAALAEASRARRHRGAVGTMALEGAKNRLLEVMWSAPRLRTGDGRRPVEYGTSAEGAP